eukprot:jgi/Tetstr1/460171/TSEL_005487.t1
MGAGGAIDDAGVLEVPRLTAMLRAFVPAPASRTFDISAQYLARSKALDERIRAQQAPGAGRALVAAGQLGRSPLAKALLGDWDKAPKAAKSDYEGLLRNVGALLGGEVVGQELQDCAVAVWNALSGAELPELEGLPAWKVTRELDPFKAMLKGALGVIEASHVRPTLASVASMRQHQSKLNPGGKGKVGSGSAGGSGASREFGADLSFAVSHKPATLEDILAAMRRGGPTPVQAATSSSGTASTLAPAALQGMMATSGRAEPEASSTALLEGGSARSAGQPSSSIHKVSLAWLQGWAEGASTVTEAHSAEQVALAVCELILNEMGEDEIASHLFDLLGDAAFEIGAELIERREPLLRTLRAAVSAAREDEASKRAVQAAGPIVTVSTESDKLMQKMARKEQRKARGKAKPGAPASDIEYIAAHGFLALGYEEVRVPATKAKPPEVPLIKIEEMEPFAQKAFAGYKTLNRIQSTIYQTGFYSNENMLVCAPTGAGKTNIAMVAVLREVSQNMKHGVVQKADFKIVYVAPMKALASEVTSTFSKRLAPLGLIVKELTGDMQLTKKELQETQMIVTTPEKWDVITRKGGDVSMAALVRLLIIDEVHLLNDDRGAVIEVLVARTLRQVEASQSMIRIVGLSATLPNYKDVASFLGVNHDTGLFFFDASYRPVPLELQFLGVSESNFRAKSQLMGQLTYDKVTDALKKGHQAMVFVHSRKDTGKTARLLAEMAAGEDAGLFDTRENSKASYP